MAQIRDLLIRDLLKDWRSSTPEGRREDIDRTWDEILAWMNSNEKLRTASGFVDTDALRYDQWPALLAAMRQERECGFCQGAQKCPHSNAMLCVVAVQEGGRLEYRVAARLCNRHETDIAAHRKADLLEESGIPPAWRKRTFDEFKAGGDRVLMMARGLAMAVTQNSRGLILGGPTGSGKTHLAVAVALEYIRQKRSVLFSPVVKLLPTIQSETVRDGISATMERAIGVDLLVLDDVGTQRETGFRDESVYTIINERYNHNRPIVITTNAMGQDAVEAAFGQDDHGKRIYSRLCEMCEICFMQGARDYRKHAR